MPAAPTRPLAVFLVEREEPVDVDLTPAGQAAVREGRRLRESFRARLRKLDDIVLVADETAAEARLEIREAAVHRDTSREDTQKGAPRRPAGLGGRIDEQVTEVGVGRVEARDYALTVRVTAGETFADLTSSTREPSASSAVDTVIRALRRWVRDHVAGRAR